MYTRKPQLLSTKPHYHEDVTSHSLTLSSEAVDQSPQHHQFQVLAITSYIYTHKYKIPMQTVIYPITTRNMNIRDIVLYPIYRKSCSTKLVTQHTPEQGQHYIRYRVERVQETEVEVARLRTVLGCEHVNYVRFKHRWNVVDEVASILGNDKCRNITRDRTINPSTMNRRLYFTG